LNTPKRTAGKRAIFQYTKKRIEKQNQAFKTARKYTTKRTKKKPASHIEDDEKKNKKNKKKTKQKKTVFPANKSAA
jgi:hypothetical protein